jgi:hypothetical protein
VNNTPGKISAITLWPLSSDYELKTCGNFFGRIKELCGILIISEFVKQYFHITMFFKTWHGSIRPNLGK